MNADEVTIDEDGRVFADGELVGRVDDDRVYDADGACVGHIDGNQVFDGVGALIGTYDSPDFRFVNGRFIHLLHDANIKLVAATVLIDF